MVNLPGIAEEGGDSMKSIKYFNTLFLVFFLVIISGNSFAENRPWAITLSPHLGGYIFEGNQKINSDPVYGFGLGVNLTERLAVEGVFDWIDTDSKSSSKEPDVEALIYRLDGLYHFVIDGHNDIVPYLSIGAGAINLNKDPGESDTDFLANYGAGLKYFITESLAARAEIRHIIDFHDDAYNNLIYTIGVTYLIGGKEKEVSPPPKAEPAQKPALAPSPMDSDGDGVNDALDKCPETPRGVSVDSEGCPLDSDKDGVPDYLDKCPGTPAGVVVDSNGCPLDSDGDGVYDYKDKCPATPKGAPVDSSGCPLDSDGDGVFDYLDKCPDTPKGIQVDAKGCPVPLKEKVSIELNVEFETNSPIVKNMYHEHIQKVADFLKAYPETEAEIDGHTDSTGTDKYNLNLSQKRAENVMKHLIDYGIDPSRMKAVGYGESRPIADNNTKEGRARNRRVVAVISTVITK
jgi:OOP family OmpA-OmpF porin